jgi:hypothetical protein
MSGIPSRITLAPVQNEMESDRAPTGAGSRLETGYTVGEGTKMLPFLRLTDEQILELLAEQPKMLSVPGVALVLVEFLDPLWTEAAVVATVYTGDGQEMSRLPVTVAGLPVIVKVADPDTMRVVEVIDPRRNGGAWPSSNHKDQTGS